MELNPTSKGSIIFNYIEHWLCCDALSAQIYGHLIITARIEVAHTHQKYSTFNYSNMELKVTRPIALRTWLLNEFFSNDVCSVGHRAAAIHIRHSRHSVGCLLPFCLNGGFCCHLNNYEMAAIQIDGSVRFSRTAATIYIFNAIFAFNHTRMRLSLNATCALIAQCLFV